MKEMKEMKDQIDIFDDIFVDSFAGGGGASTGIELALGRPVDIAINHDMSAILMHKRNHPYTEHYREDIWQVDPVAAVRGRLQRWVNNKIIFKARERFEDYEG